MSSITLPDIIKFILVCVPFVLMCLATLATNLPKEYRGHQFPSMIFGLIYSVIAIARYNAFYLRFLALMESIVAMMTTYANKNQKLEGILTPIANFLENIDWNVFFLFVGNFLLLTLFLILKRILLPIFKKIWKKENVYALTSGHFYTWAEKLSIFCLKPNLYSVKKLLKVYYYITCVVVSVLMVLCKKYPEWPGFDGVFYPFAAVIIVGEIFFFLDGLTEYEIRDRISGDDGSSERVALYFPFFNFLAQVFGDRLIHGNIIIPSFGFLHHNRDIVKKYESVETQEAKLTHLFFYKKATVRDQLNYEDEEDPINKRKSTPTDSQAIQLDEGLVDASYRLMNGESVMFATPFYADYSDYIFLPINRALMHGNKVLCIIGRNGIDNDIITWLKDSLEKTANVPELWDVGKLNADQDFLGDVGVVNAADVMSSNIVTRNLGFLSKVTEVIMLEPSQFISTAQLSISVYITNITKDATYYIFDKNNDGLLDTVSHLIRKSLTAVTPTNRERNIHSYMLWKADGEHLSHRLFSSVARYLGVGTELMITALKDQIDNTEWYSYGKFPVDEMKWISQQYYPVLCKYAALPERKEELDTRMKFNHNLWSAQKDKYRYIVVEDEFCNLFEMARQFSFRGTKETFVNVISQNYMLRDYMQLTRCCLRTIQRQFRALFPIMQERAAILL